MAATGRRFLPWTCLALLLASCSGPLAERVDPTKLLQSELAVRRAEAEGAALDRELRLVPEPRKEAGEPPEYPLLVDALKRHGPLPKTNEALDRAIKDGGKQLEAEETEARDRW